MRARDPKKPWALSSLILDEAAAWLTDKAWARASRATPFHGIAVPLDDPIGRRILSTGWFEATQLCAVTRMLEEPGFVPVSIDKDGLFLDVGANIGLYCIAFSKHFAQSLAIEANPRTFALLKANMALRALAGVACLPFAASDEAGEAEIRVPDNGNLGWASFHADGKAWRDASTAIRVSCQTIDHLVATHGQGRKVAMMKLDVEGHECSVLRGARGVLQRDHPVVLFEVLDTEAGAACAHVLEDCGYCDYFKFERDRSPLRAVGGLAVRAEKVARADIARADLVCAVARGD